MNLPRLWPGMIFGLLGLNVCIVAVTVVFATRDRSVAVEPDYYQQAVHWDDHARQEARNRELGWSVRITTERAKPARARLTLELRDRTGQPIERADVHVQAFPSARANDRELLQLHETAPGAYSADLASARGGLWAFRVAAGRGTELFTASLEQDVGAPTRSGS